MLGRVLLAGITLAAMPYELSRDVPSRRLRRGFLAARGAGALLVSALAIFSPQADVARATLCSAKRRRCRGRL
jgi:hypothetical protein